MREDRCWCPVRAFGSLSTAASEPSRTGRLDAWLKSVTEARQYYAEEFLNYRHKQPTPYMDRLRVPTGGDTTDIDERALSDEDLEEAARAGEAKRS